MTALKYFSERAVETLYQSVEQHLDWYYSPSNPERFIRGMQHAIRETTMSGVSLKDILKTGDEPSKLDAKNAMAVYADTPMNGLQPHEAADERLWVHLCHTDCPQYVTDRWLKNRPVDDKMAASRVRNHFFAKGNRGVIRDNALSRLWWLGYIAQEVSSDDPRKFLQILLHRQDLRSALIERPSVSMNRRVLRSVYCVMQAHWDSAASRSDRVTSGETSPLFVRETFRDWMIRLNRRGGVVLLDALDDKGLVELVRCEADEALANGNERD